MPFLLVFAFPRGRKMMRKTSWTGLSLCLLALATLSVAGCGGGGFTGTEPTSNATPGNYLIAIVNASQPAVVVAEIPLVVAGNL